MKLCLRALSLALFASIFISSGCQKKSDDDSGGDGTVKPTGIKTFGAILGVVKDADNQVLAGVEIQVIGNAAQFKTNEQGYFSLGNLPEQDRLVVNFYKKDYVMTSEITKIRGGESSFLEVVMVKEGEIKTFPAVQGAIIKSETAEVKIPSNSLVDKNGRIYNGEVKLSITVFDPTTPKGMGAFPGVFEGVSSDNSIVPIESYGFMDVTPRTENGEPLQLASGKMADIAIPIANSLLSSAPPTMPLWYFNPTDGKWHQEGELKRDGNVYRGKIAHFSIWNCDVAYDRSYVEGRVVDCSNGAPVKGARVTIQGKRGWTSGETSTPDEGTFRIPVDSNHDCQIWPSKNGVSGDVKSFKSAGTNGVYNVGDICLGTPKLKITLTWDLNPNDLDAHLTIPSQQDRAHISYHNKGVKVENSMLDTDDMTSFGPEIITTFGLQDGVYRYSVHHYAGPENISTSKANASMIVEGLGIYSLTPPAGAKEVKDLWVLWDITVAGGKVTRVDTINTYFHGVNDTSSSAPFSPGYTGPANGLLNLNSLNFDKYNK